MKRFPREHMVQRFSSKSGRPLVALKTPKRNDKCLCGSGLKFKNCCIDKNTNPYKSKS